MGEKVEITSKPYLSLYNTVADKYDDLQNFIGKYNHIPNFKHLIGDIFSSFNKATPILKSQTAEELNMEFEGLDELYANEELIKKIMSQDDYKHFNQKCRFDDTLSLLATKNYSETVLEWLKENADEDLQKALNGEQPMPTPQPQQQPSNDGNGSGQGDGQGNGQDDGQDNGQGQGNGHTPQEQAMIDAINNMMNNLQQNEDSMNDLKQRLKQAQKEADDLNDDIQDIFGKGSGNERPTYDEIPLGEKLALAELLRNTPSVRQIADWCGRFTFYAKKKQKNKKAETTVRSGITMGNRLELITPQELVMLDDEDFQMDVLKRIAEGQFQNYDIKQRGQKAKGSLIICLDESGSMRSLEEQAKGFVLSLMIIARKQKRDVVYIPFSSDVGNIRKFKKGVFKAEDIKAIATTFMNGGTDFVEPLKVARKIIETDIKDGDIIFVTDGEDRVHKDFRDEFKKIKKKMDFNMLSLILCDNYTQNKIEEAQNNIEEINYSNLSYEDKERQLEQVYNRNPLLDMSDKIEAVTDLTDEKSFVAFEI